MNIKSLLIGSAAATVAATGAQAADAIFVPEPEPMEYVRVCDVYGAGFFYIPGTETCLKIGGYVRYEIGWNEDDDGWRKAARGTVTIDARSETEYGTLGSFIELRGQTQSGFLGTEPYGSDDYFRLNQAYISLGGLFVGLKTTIWDAGLSGEFDSGGYDSRIHTIGYTFDAANGVYVTIALEEYDNNYDYTPNVVGNLGFAQGWGSVNLWGAYDATAEEWMAKAIAKVNVAQNLTLELLGTYESGLNVYSVWNPDDITGYEWSAGGYLKYAATPKMSIGFGGQYFADSHAIIEGIDPVTGDIVDVALDGNDDWALGAVIDYELVENFNTKLAVNYTDGDSYEDGSFGGFIRFQRDF